MNDEERNEEMGQEEDTGEDAEGNKGAVREDNPEPGEGVGEGDRGLGTQTDAVEGANSDVTRGRQPSGEGVARQGGPPNEEDDSSTDRSQE